MDASVLRRWNDHHVAFLLRHLYSTCHRGYLWRVKRFTLLGLDLRYVSQGSCIFKRRLRVECSFLRFRLVGHLIFLYLYLSFLFSYLLCVSAGEFPRGFLSFSLMLLFAENGSITISLMCWLLWGTVSRMMDRSVVNVRNEWIPLNHLCVEIDDYYEGYPSNLSYLMMMLPALMNISSMLNMQLYNPRSITRPCPAMTTFAPTTDPPFVIYLLHAQPRFIHGKFWPVMG